MATCVESRNVHANDPHQDKNVWDDDDEDFRGPGRVPSFLRRSNSEGNEQAVVLRPRGGDRIDRRWSPSPELTEREPVRERSPAAPPRIRRERSSSLVEEGNERGPGRGRSSVIIRERELSAPVDTHDHVDKEIDDSPILNGPSLEGVNTVLGPKANHDTTVHLELDIEEDVGCELEEFSRLKRLGNFHAAEKYFQTNLYEYLDVSPVAVEYAEMLLQQGAYHRLKDLLRKQELNAPAPPPSRISPRMVSFTDTPNQGKDREVEQQPIPRRSQSIDVVDEPTYTATRMYQDREIKRDAEDFNLAFQMIEVTAQMFSQGWLRPALSLAQDAKHEFYNQRIRNGHLDSNVPLSSTEIQIVNYWQGIRFNKITISDKSRWLWLSAGDPRDEGDQLRSLCLGWSGLYDSLRDEGRIWELKDVISSSLEAFGGKETWTTLIGEDLYHANFFDKLLEDWGVNREYDESTYLAMLAILVDLCYDLLSVPDHLFVRFDTLTAKRCLEHARNFAECIKENDLPNVKSRPYISWIIVRKGLERKLANTAPGINPKNRGFSSQYLNNFPGFVVMTNVLPIYVPIDSENPGWRVSEQPVETDELLQHALEASQELEDYKLEVSCLQEMICYSPQPKQLFERLVHVQKTLQGDMVGYLKTLLSKYLIVTDEESRQSLNDELLMFDAHQPILYDIQAHIVQWFQRMVQAALLRHSSRYTAEIERVEQMGKGLLCSLPGLHKEAFNLYYPGGANTARTVSPVRTPRSYNNPSPPPPPSPARIPHSYNHPPPPPPHSTRIATRVANPSPARTPDKYNTSLSPWPLPQIKIRKEREKEREKEGEKERDEEEERKYQERLKADLQKAGLDSQKIAEIQGKIFKYTGMARQDLSQEAINSLDEIEAPTKQNIEVHRNTTSLSKKNHRTPEVSSVDTIARKSWPQTSRETETTDINWPLSPRPMDNKLDSRDVSDSNSHDYNLTRQYGNRSPSSPPAGDSYPPENDSSQPPTNPCFMKENKTQANKDFTNSDNKDDATSKPSDEVKPMEEHSRPEKLKRSDTFAHVESDDDIDNIAGITGESES